MQIKQTGSFFFGFFYKNVVFLIKIRAGEIGSFFFVFLMKIRANKTLIFVFAFLIKSKEENIYVC